jgi:hypothetical protein
MVSDQELVDLRLEQIALLQDSEVFMLAAAINGLIHRDIGTVVPTGSLGRRVDKHVRVPVDVPGDGNADLRWFGALISVAVARGNVSMPGPTLPNRRRRRR